MKMDSQKIIIICRLCFKMQDDPDNFKAIEKDLKDVLDKVLQNLDLAAIHNPVICTRCADTLMKCFDFKTQCLDTHNYISLFINKDTVKLDLIDAYISKNEDGTGVHDVCGLCMSSVENYFPLSVDVEGDVALKRMIEQCIPEVDMNVIKKPVICLPCHASLENCFRFLTNCLVVEEKIRTYRESQDTGSNGGMDPCRLLQFAITDVTGNKGDSLSDIIKVENQFCEEIEHADETGIANVGDVFKFEQMASIDGENSEKQFKIKNESFMDTDEVKFNNEEYFTPKNMSAFKYFIKIEEPFCEKNELKEENLVEQDQKYLPNEEIEIKTDESDFNRSEDGILTELKISKGDLEKHLLVHKDPSHIMYKCDRCWYQTKYKSYLNKHLLKHKDSSEVTMYKCDSCCYQTKYEESLKRHLLKHKDASEVTMYKCDFCLYETKYKTDLKRHSLKHRDPSQVTMYECNSCSYQTKDKSHLYKHLLKHKDSSEVTMYKCDSCSYQTKYRRSLKKHSLKHKDASEVTMYKCNLCLIETKYKKNLEYHLRRHRASSQKTMYKCDSCLFLTKHESIFNRHLLTHKDPSEARMYKCDFCSFQTKHRRSLAVHLWKHKDPSEVTMYKCDFCLYQTKRKWNLTKHLVTHEDPREATMYKCDLCSFQAKSKNGHNRHMLKHNKPSEVTINKCSSCSFQTKHKNIFNRHLLKHKDPSEVTMYKCDFCLCQSKHKGNIKRHMLKHTDPSEGTVYAPISNKT